MSSNSNEVKEGIEKKIQKETKKEIKFFDFWGQEVQENGSSAASHYIWCVKRALAQENDMLCFTSFMNDMDRNDETRRAFNHPKNRTLILTLKGEALKKFITGYKISGIAKVEMHSNETPPSEKKEKVCEKPKF